MTKSNLSPHDRFFKKSMTDPEIAKAFFQEYLPTDIMEQVNLDTLSMIDESQIDFGLRLQVVDLLYAVQFGKEQGYIYLLCEHLSTPKPQVIFQLVKYIISIMDKHLIKHKTNKLPIVYPLILYNGKQKFNHTRSFLELFGENKKLAEAIMLNPFKLIDIKDIPDQVIQDHLKFGIMVQVLNHLETDVMRLIKDKLGPALIVIENQGNHEYIQSLIYYLYETREVPNKQDLANLIKNELFEKMEAKMTTIADALRAEGRQEGIQKGIQKGVQKGQKEGKVIAFREMVTRMQTQKGMSVEQIANLLGLSPQEVEKLKSQNGD